MSAQPGKPDETQARVPRPLGLRILYWFWGVLAVALVGGAGALQWLGPPAVAHVAAASAAAGPAADIVREIAKPPPGADKPQGDTPPPGSPPHGDAPAPSAPLRHATGAPIAAPDAALSEPSAQYPDLRLPRIAADGRSPMQVYAGGFDTSDTRPRVALVIAGIGQSDLYSDDANRLLPAGVTFAVSPYANQPGRLLSDIRARGHEYLMSLPMEPQGSPINDAGPQSLLTGATAVQNMQRLDWSLSRFAGYAGVTNALDGLRGERFTAAPTQLNPVLDSIAARGLFFVDAAAPSVRAGGAEPLHIAGRSVDIVIDDPPVRVEIEQKLLRLEQLARDHGSALGLAGYPHPVTIDRVAAWTNNLNAHGLVLAPVSVLVLPAGTPPPAGGSPGGDAAPPLLHTTKAP